MNLLKASEGEDTVVNSIGDVLEQQVSKKQLVEDDSSCTRLKKQHLSFDFRIVALRATAAQL